MKMWEKFFVEPSEWAKSFTKVSRNFLNFGLACFVLSIVYAWSVDFVQLPSSENTDSIEAELQAREGTYQFITGGKSSTPRVCVIERETKNSPLCTSALGGMKNYGSKFDGLPATAWTHPKYGVVKVVVASSTVLDIRDIESEASSAFQKFAALLFFATLSIAISIARQIYLLRKRG